MRWARRSPACRRARADRPQRQRHFFQPSAVVVCCNDLARQNRTRIDRATCFRGRARPPSRDRTRRDAQARGADRADAARADRDDDDRHRHDRRLGAEAVAAASLAHTVLLRQLHLRHGPGIGGRAAGRAGVRRAQAASDPAFAPRRPVGRAADLAAADGAAVLGRADPADAGPGAGDRASGAGISRRPGLDHPAGPVVPRRSAAS